MVNPARNTLMVYVKDIKDTPEVKGLTQLRSAFLSDQVNLQGISILQGEPSAEILRGQDPTISHIFDDKGELAERMQRASDAILIVPMKVTEEGIVYREDLKNVPGNLAEILSNACGNEVKVCNHADAFLRGALDTLPALPATAMGVFFDNGVGCATWNLGNKGVGEYRLGEQEVVEGGVRWPKTAEVCGKGPFGSRHFVHGRVRDALAVPEKKADVLAAFFSDLLGHMEREGQVLPSVFIVSGESVEGVSSEEMEEAMAKLASLGRVVQIVHVAQRDPVIFDGARKLMDS